jgi:hypothetical protein
MSAIDWFYSISIIAVHVLLAVILIHNWLSFHLRWLSLAVIVRIFTDMVLLSYPMDEVTYFWLFYAFQIVGVITFFIAYLECKRMIANSDIGYAMLIYLIPETIQTVMFFMKEYAIACKFADYLRPFNLLCMIYICIIMMRRKGNPNAIVQPLRS